MDTISAVLGAIGLAGAAGLNAYVPLVVISALARSGVIHLTGPFALLGATWVLALVSVLLVVELVVDKIPGADHVNDLVQTAIRPTAGAILFAANTGVIHELHPAIPLILGLLVAFSVHATKAAARPVLNASTLGASAPIVSIVEDVASLGTAFAAVFIPVFVALIAVGFIALAFVLFSRVRRARTIRRANSV